MLAPGGTPAPLLLPRSVWGGAAPAAGDALSGGGVGKDTSRPWRRGHAAGPVAGHEGRLSRLGYFLHRCLRCVFCIYSFCSIPGVLQCLSPKQRSSPCLAVAPRHPRGCWRETEAPRGPDPTGIRRALLLGLGTFSKVVRTRRGCRAERVPLQRAAPNCPEPAGAAAPLHPGAGSLPSIPSGSTRGTLPPPGAPSSRFGHSFSTLVPLWWLRPRVKAAGDRTGTPGRCRGRCPGGPR